MRQMKQKLFLLVATLTLLISQSCTQRQTNDDDYNYRKAVEAFYDEDDNEKSFEMVNDILDNNPGHIDSRFLRSKIYWSQDMYDAALRDVSYAISHYKGKPSVFKSTLYGLRGEIFADMDMDSIAARDYRKAVRRARRDNPERVQDYTFDYAQALFYSDNLAGAEKVYLRMLKDNKYDVSAMVGLSRNYMTMEKYDEALKYLETAESYDASYSQIYRLKMQVLDKMGRTDESVDAALKYVETDDEVPVRVVAEYADKHYSYAVAKVKAELHKPGSSGNWMALLILLHEHHGEYAKAIELYNKVEEEHGVHVALLANRANCYSEIGEYEKAINDYSKAIELEPDADYYLALRGDAYRSVGMYQEAIADYSAAIDIDPSVGYYYYARGWSFELSGDDVRALADYETGIDLDKDYPYLFQSRGDLYLKLGMTDLANADFEMVLAKDTVAEDGSCRQYALIGLGRNDEAIGWMEKIIENNPNDGGCWYDKACVYARMNRKTEALEALETAFEKGYCEFVHLEHDSDMDTLRDMPQYKALIERYKDRPVEVFPEESFITPDVAETVVSEIKLRKMAGGTYEIPCSINGLPLKFIFDTGASDVTLSSVEANFMLKNDYLSAKDFKGSRHYLTADGNISDGAVVCIREVQVGDVKLKNIEASVVRNQKAPLLLGQSVLERFGSVTIDNENSTLIIKK